MKDTRIALSYNSVLLYDKGNTIKIISEVGRGASCIVYDAVYRDAIEVEHKIRIKECYPNDLLILRNDDNTLTEFKNESEKFNEAKEKFIEAYKKNVDIRNTLSLTNSTINSSNIIEANHTIYIVMTMDEGLDYRKYEDKSLKELFIHIRSLAELISKYHKRGYLHLDIKPENIFILPETDEHILLFDFDSILTQEELKSNDKIKLSFTEGFSAPEQIQGKINKIGEFTDIYSIGALMFYKLFGRKPKASECRLARQFQFEKIKFANEIYNPKLYRVLEVFLRKTLSVSIRSRWHDMQQVVNHLDELIKLADIEGLYLKDTFQYNSAYFVGRKEELAQIAEILKQNQIVFISGIGGIGKTELVKQYANKYRDQYDSVVFTIFNQNLEMLVCDEISINKVSREETESSTDYFERKIEILKKIVSANDLIIIDNFDVESDDQLERLLSCPCKFIFTTRKDFRDYNFKQINIERLTDKEEILELFYIYNDIEYAPDEEKAIEQLIHLVEHHTMTVELIAKYLRSTGESPISLYTRFKKKEGITNTKEVQIKQRKDRNLRSKSVTEHLSILFDIFNFDEIEKEIMRSLSLFEGIRIKKSKFEKLCQLKQISQKLDRLIKNSWVEYNESTEKVALHQVIQDLIYVKLKPTSANCKSISLGMYTYVTEKTTSYSEYRIRKNVFDVFMNRISGFDIAYAKLCVEYGKENALNEAEQICHHYKTTESYDLLQKLYRKRIRKVCECTDIFEKDIELKDYSKKQFLTIGEMLDKVIQYCQLSSDEPEERIKKLLSVAKEIDAELESTSIMLCFEEMAELDAIYQKIIALYDLITDELPNTKFSLKEKEKLYMEIQKFYSEEDRYTAMYRCEHYADIEKVCYYQTILNQLREKEVLDDSEIKIIRINDISSFSVAEKYQDEGHYEEAIQYYKKAYEEENEPYETTLQAIAHVYLSKGETAKAIKYLELVLDHDKEKENDPNAFFYYSSYICIDLIKLLIEVKEYERAKKYAIELIYYQGNKLENTYDITMVLTAYYYLYSLEMDTNKKSILWSKCLHFYKKLGKNELDEELNDFISEYLDKEDTTYKEILKVINRMQHWKQTEVKKKLLLKSIERYKSQTGFKKYHIYMLLQLAELTNDYPYEDIKEGLNYCEIALSYYREYLLNDAYLLSLIYKTKAEIISNDNDYDYKQIQEIQKKCDYWLIATVKSRGMSIEKQIDMWNDAADRYRYIDCNQMELKCLNKLYALLMKVLNQYEFSKFETSLWYVMQGQIRIYIHMRDFDKAEKVIRELYQYTIEYILNEHKIENRGFYVDKLKELSKRYVDINKKQQALSSYLIALYMALTDDFKDLLVNWTSTEEINIELICNRIDKIVEKPSIENVDEVIGLKDELIKYKRYCNDIENKVSSIVIKITDIYQNQEIEFKG